MGVGCRDVVGFVAEFAGFDVDFSTKSYRYTSQTYSHTQTPSMRIDAPHRVAHLFGKLVGGVGITPCDAHRTVWSSAAVRSTRL